MGLSNIQWTTYTFNPWMGCRKVAPECVNCYIVETPPFRFRGITHGAQRVRTSESTWNEPLKWNRKAANQDERSRVFCLSLGDWLDDENVPIEWLADLLKLIHATPNLDWLLLTKRPQNWESRLLLAWTLIGTPETTEETFDRWLQAWRIDREPPTNVWIGVSAGADQSTALDIPAKIHFLSCEPMLHQLDTKHAARFDWIIFGGESGKKARECNVNWILDGVVFCRDNDIACFVKQLGARPFQKVKSAMSDLHQLKDSHGGNMEEWPEELRVREFPKP